MLKSVYSTCNLTENTRLNRRKLLRISLSWAFLMLSLAACSPFTFDHDQPTPSATTSIDFAKDPSLGSEKTTWANEWSRMKPISVAASSFSLPVEHRTYTGEMGFAIDYPAEWCVNDQRDLLQFVSSVAADPSQGCMTNYEVKLEITFALRPSTWTLVDDLNAFQQSGPFMVVEMQNLLLAGGIPAARLEFNGESGKYRVLVAIINDWSIRIYGYGDAKLIDAVANTLRASQ